MYVCICKSVTDAQIQSEVENGASSLRELAENLCVATQCGKCAVRAKLCLNDAQQKVLTKNVISSAA